MSLECYFCQERVHRSSELVHLGLANRNWFPSHWCILWTLLPFQLSGTGHRTGMSYRCQIPPVQWSDYPMKSEDGSSQKLPCMVRCRFLNSVQSRLVMKKFSLGLAKPTPETSASIITAPPSQAPDKGMYACIYWSFHAWSTTLFRKYRETGPPILCTTIVTLVWLFCSYICSITPCIWL